MPDDDKIKQPSILDSRTMNKCEHVWSGDSFDATKDVLEIELTHVMIQIKCQKCGMNATVDSDINWKPVSWEIFESSEITD